MFFATTAENAPIQTDNVAAVWNVNDNGTCQEIVRFKKDRWHSTLCMFGMLHFPYRSTLADELYFHAIGVTGENRTYKIRRSGQAKAV